MDSGFYVVLSQVAEGWVAAVYMRDLKCTEFRAATSIEAVDAANRRVYRLVAEAKTARRAA